ncbi:MAG: hypothetical protein MSA56_05970 [Clostridium sp.]|nr:hypothetical protein [Clostridium sp.]
MDREKLMAEIEEAFAPMFKIIEYNECMFYQLLELLSSKGLITKDDYNKYLSNEAINKKMDMVNAALKEEEN